MAESDCFGFDAVHQDHTDARERIVIELAERKPGELAPGEYLTIERDAGLFENIEGHGSSLGMTWSDMQARRRNHLARDPAWMWAGAIASVERWISGAPCAKRPGAAVA
jgi:hypothetical protein